MPREYKLKKASAEMPPPLSEDGRIDFAAVLNEQQVAAVTAPPGQALVIAGAGSGKTRTLTYRVAYLLQNAISPKNILLLTFTNKAAREMLERVEQLLPGRTGGLWGGTFHSVCNRILRRHPDAVGLTRQFTILDSEDQKSMITKAIKESGLAVEVQRKTGSKFPKAPVIQGLISLAANTGEPLEDLVSERFCGNDAMVDGILKIAEIYTQKKREGNAADFDDLLVLTLQLLRQEPAILEQYQHQFQFILVDEYQDTNALQGEFIELLAGKHGNLMVVGDDAQSIYSWRGADFRYILEFPKRYPKAKVYRIETNYRSVPEVLTLANAAIRHNREQYEKTLRPVRHQSGFKPVLLPTLTTKEQAYFVVQRIEELVGKGFHYRDIAVLYRAHFQSMELQMHLTSQRIPFQITSGLKFFEQAHIKDFSAFLKFVSNPRDEAAFDRLVQLLSGVGESTASNIWQAWRELPPFRTGNPPGSFSDLFIPMKVPPKARAEWNQLAYTLDELVTPEGKLMPPKKAMRSIMEGIYGEYAQATFENAEARLQDLEQFRRFGEDFATVDELLSELSLLSGPEQVDAPNNKENRDSVCLSSVHQAKGLEWRVVFLIGLTEGMFPSARAVEEGGDAALEEERRLFYVATTRAKDQLYLTYPKMTFRPHEGEMRHTPSMFLAEVPRQAIDVWRVGR